MQYLFSISPWNEYAEIGIGLICSSNTSWEDQQNVFTKKAWIHWCVANCKSWARWFKLGKVSDTLNLPSFGTLWGVQNHFWGNHRLPSQCTVHTGSDWDCLAQKVKKWSHDISQMFIIFGTFVSSSIRIDTLFCNC